MRNIRNVGWAFTPHCVSADKHMNVVLADAEEFRRLPPKKGSSDADREVRRPLGFILIRGEEVVSLTVEGPPPTEYRPKKDSAPARTLPPSSPGPPAMNPTFSLFPPGRAFRIKRLARYRRLQIARATDMPRL